MRTVTTVPTQNVEHFINAIFVYDSLFYPLVCLFQQKNKTHNKLNKKNVIEQIMCVSLNRRVILNCRTW